MKLIKNTAGVSHVIGYILTLSLTAVIIAAASLTTNTIVTEKTDVAAEAYAENIANRVADAIVNCYLIKEKYPEANYSRTIELPLDLVGRSYYISVDNDNVYVKTRDGKVKVASTLYNVTNRLLTDISGTAYGGTGGLTISCEKYDYVHKFDFGTDDSDATLNYSRVTDSSIGAIDWESDLGDWYYRTPINISNPIEGAVGDLVNYQILIQLNDKNFGYSNAKPNGSDLRFYDDGGTLLDYWIERWGPSDTHTSRVWVKVDSIPQYNSDPNIPECTINMYYGYYNLITPDCPTGSDGSATFDTALGYFFDDFDGSSLDTGKWVKYPTDADISVSNSMLILLNGQEIRTNQQVGDSLKPCIIETKAKALGADNGDKEASMFVRATGDSSDTGFVFSSGDFVYDPEYNLALVEPGNPDIVHSVTGDPAVNDDWNRLSFILNGDDHFIFRYSYKDFSTDDEYIVRAFSGQIENYFGLCVREGDDFSNASYDWILVRQYAANAANGEVPIAKACGSHSKIYEWDETTTPPPAGSIDRPGAGNDIVYGTVDPATFEITGLTTGQEYSLTFLVGDVNGESDPDNFLVEGMTIKVYDDDAKTIPLGENAEIINCNPTKKVLIPSITSDDGTIYIEFSDSDTGPDYYWAVNEMTIQNGNRIINLEGGR